MLKGGCWRGTLGTALPCPLPPCRAQHPGSSPSIAQTAGLGTWERRTQPMLISNINSQTSQKKPPKPSQTNKNALWLKEAPTTSFAGTLISACIFPGRAPVYEILWARFWQLLLLAPTLLYKH